MKRFLALGSLLLLVFMTGYAGLTYGQAETGTIDGTVSDSTGAVVPGAKVLVKSVTTGAEHATQTDGNGRYVVSNLLPGMYSITVEAANLAKKEIRAQVTVGSRVEVNFTLTVGVTSTVIEVVGAGGVNVNTETATIGTVIDSQAIMQLPTVNRDAYTFAAYVGNASDGSPTGGMGNTGSGVGVSFNGLRAASTNILLDGAANNDEFAATVGQSIPLDSVQEYSVLTNNFTAEFGRASGGVVNLATKSGSNNFHGSAYEYNRVSALATENFYDKANGIDKSHYTRNQFGGSLGGPIKKDKLFFFGNAEWNRIRSNATVTRWVMDPAFIALAQSPTTQFFSSTGALRSNAQVNAVEPFDASTLCTGNSQGTDAYNASLGYMTCNSVPAGTPFMDKVTYGVPSDAGAGNPANQLLTVGRIDWNISDKTQLYGRYALNKEDDFAGVISNSPYAGYDTPQNIMQNNFLLSLTHSFNPTWTVQNKVVFNRLSLLQPLGTAPITPGLFFNPSVGTTYKGNLVQMPGYLTTSPGNGIPFGGPQNFLQYYQDWSHSMGRHTLRFGGSYNYEQDNRTFGAYETPVGAFGRSTGISDASLNRFLGGYWGRFQGAIYPQGHYPCAYDSVTGVGCVDNTTTPPTAHPEGDVVTPVGFPVFARSNRYHEFALYVTDSWKMSNRLTVNLGLRYEYYGVQHDTNPKLDSNYYMGTGSNFYEQIANGAVMLAPDSPIGELWKPSWKNFGPKVGFAYDFRGDGKTVLRGGYSIAYERNFGNVTFNVIQNPPNYSVISLQDGLDVSTGNMGVTTDPAGPLSGSGTTKAIPNVSLRAVNPNIKQAYAQLYSLTLEHELTHNMIVGFDYSGSHGVHLYDIANINATGSGAIYLGDANPDARIRTTQYSNMNFRSSNGISHYNALVARIQMNNWAKSGLTLNANYTFGHTFDELSDTFSSSANNYNLGYLSAFNPRQDYGNAYMDIRHRFTATAIWDVPFAKSTHGWVKQVADGWTVAPLLTFETGTPYSIFDCTNAAWSCIWAVNSNGGIPRGAPQKLQSIGADDFIYTPLYTAYDSTGSPTATALPLFDSSYANPINGYSDYGPYPAAMNARNVFRGPGQWNVDLGIYKSFFLTEKFKLQFRAEMYNAFNHANLYTQTGDTDVSGFSVVDATKGYTALGGKEYRTIQLALRLTF